VVAAAICIATAAAAAAEEVGRVGLEGLARVEGGKERELVVGVRLNIYRVRNGSAPSDHGVRYGVGRLIARVSG